MPIQLRERVSARWEVEGGWAILLFFKFFPNAGLLFPARAGQVKKLTALTMLSALVPSTMLFSSLLGDQRVWWGGEGRVRVALGLGCFVCIAFFQGCVREQIPDPHFTVVAYARAAESGDEEAMHALLRKEAQRAYGLQGTRRLMKESRVELAKQGTALKSSDATLRATAELEFDEGDSAELVWENGRFFVSSAGMLPSQAGTPSQALVGLRRALLRKNFYGLLGLLSHSTRQAVDRDLKSLVNGLSQPSTLNVRAVGDFAEVEVPGGHLVRLRREAGIWRIEDFE